MEIPTSSFKIEEENEFFANSYKSNRNSIRYSLSVAILSSRGEENWIEIHSREYSKEDVENGFNPRYDFEERVIAKLTKLFSD